MGAQLNLPGIMQSDFTQREITPVHIAAVNSGEKKNEQPRGDVGKKKKKEGGLATDGKAQGGENNGSWCKVQDLRFLPAVLFHLCLTLEASQSNMPLC